MVLLPVTLTAVITTEINVDDPQIRLICSASPIRGGSMGKKQTNRR